MIFKLMKRIVAAGGYDRTDLQEKMDVYLMYDRLTADEYAELAAELGKKV